MYGGGLKYFLFKIVLKYFFKKINFDIKTSKRSENIKKNQNFSPHSQTHH
jgi:hypothetical protein